MKIAVIGSDRVPTKPGTDSGLANDLWEIADGLARHGHVVTLFGAPGSELMRGWVRGHPVDWAQEPCAFEAYLDGSHTHALSKAQPDWPVVNRLGDSECTYQPPNGLVDSMYMQGKFPGARRVRKGMALERIPFCPTGNGYLAFFARVHPLKGYETAVEAAALAKRPLRLAGEWLGAPIPGHVGVLQGEARWAFLGHADALLYPSVADASPRAILEAAACGVPTITLDRDGAREHVTEGISGYVCGNAQEMAEWVVAARQLDRHLIRAWAMDCWRLEPAIRAVEETLVAVANGERW